MFKIGDRVTFDQDEHKGKGIVRAIDGWDDLVVEPDAPEKFAHAPNGAFPYRHWFVDPSNAQPEGQKDDINPSNAQPEGQKDDNSKLRMDLIPAKSLRLILEHVWSPDGDEDEPASLERCLDSLVVWRETGDVGMLAYAASDALELCGGGIASVSGEGLEEVARVLKYGAFDAPRPDGTTGYGENNWQLVTNPLDRYYAAAMRHWARAQQGEHLDPVSGRLHVAHLACCLLFLLYFCD